MDNPLKETFSEQDLTISPNHSFATRIEMEIEKVKHQLREIQPEENEDINFYFNGYGLSVMVIGDKPEHLYNNEFDRHEIQAGTKTKFLMRKLEDLNYAQKNGEFPDDLPMPTLVS